MRFRRLYILIIGAMVMLAAACSDGERKVTILNDGFAAVTVDRCADVCDASVATNKLDPRESLTVNVPSSGEVVWYVVWDLADEVIGCLPVQSSDDGTQIVFPISFRVTCP
jgi:hypothetical protein